MKKYILVFSLLLSFLIVNINKVNAKENAVQSIDININIDNQGNANIQEIWNIDVYEGTEIYKIMNHIYDSEITDFYVVDDHGYMFKTMDVWDIQRSFDYKSYKCGIIQDGDHYELCFGITDYGHRQYTLNYKITNFVKEYKDYQGFVNLLVSDMTLPVKDFTVTISSLHKFTDDISDIYCFGFNGTMYFDNNNIFIKNTTPIELRQKVQIVTLFKEDLFHDLTSSSSGLQSQIKSLKKDSLFDENRYYKDNVYHSFLLKDDYTMVVFVLGLILSGFIGLLLLVFYTSYKSKLKEFSFNDNTQIKYDKIKVNKNYIDCHLFELYYLTTITDITDETNRHNLIASIMMDWINKGILTFKQIKNESDYEISFHNHEFEFELENELYEYLKEASGTNLLLEKDEFDRWAQENYEKIDLWLDKVCLFIENKYKNNNLMEVKDVEGQWLFKKVNVTRDVYDTSIKNKIMHMLGLKEFLEGENYKRERRKLTKDQLDHYMVYVYLFDLFEDIQDELMEKQTDENNYTKVVSKISKSAKK